MRMTSHTFPARLPKMAAINAANYGYLEHAHDNASMSKTMEVNAKGTIYAYTYMI